MPTDRTLPSAAARLATALALALALSAAATAQSGRRPPPKPLPGEPASDGSDVRLATQEVLLAVTVRDVDGRPVTGLGLKDFIIAEDRVRQELTSCGVAEVPVNVVLVLDASGSVFSELGAIRAAAQRFVDALGPEDRVSVVQFGDKVELLQDWTTDREALRHAVGWRYRSSNSTAFWDAVYLAADEQLPKVDGRRAIIVLTDGVDTTSKVAPEHARAALDRAGASVYVVSQARALIERAKPFTGFSGTLRGTARRAREAIVRLTEAEDTLRQLADRHGGRMFSPLDKRDLDAAYAEVATELKQQYVLTYVSQNEARDGRWRAIEIFLSRPGLSVRTRKGYVAN
jgi:Ca-activated chloride channel family protein